jgi:predicted PurR-regulated permease PerM
MSTPPESAVFKVIAVLLVVFALAFFAPFWAWIILGLWFGMFGQRLLVPIAKFLKGRERAASVLTVGLLVVIIAPIAFVVFALASDAVGLVKKLLESSDAKNMAESLVSSGDEEPNIVSVVKTAGPKAWGILTMVAGEATKVLIGFLIFLTVAYSALVEGPGAYAWCERHVPIDPRYLKRFTEARRAEGSSSG